MPALQLNIAQRELINKLALIIVLVAQIIFWNKTNHIKPDMIIVPDVPKETTVKLLSLGDSQFYFRQLAFKIQNAGDSWGRFTALKDYNYKDLQGWFFLLDSLDPISNFVPSIASYYFSQTQRPEDTIYIIEYLREHYKHDPTKKWWWLTQATHIASHKLKNKELALEIAYELASTPLSVNMPLWARQMPAFIHEQLGETEAAVQIIADILENVDNFTPGELNFMEYFLRERLEDEKFKYEIIQELRKRASWDNKKIK